MQFSKLLSNSFVQIHQGSEYFALQGGQLEPMLYSVLFLIMQLFRHCGTSLDFVRGRHEWGAELFSGNLRTGTRAVGAMRVWLEGTVT